MRYYNQIVRTTHTNLIKLVSTNLLCNYRCDSLSTSYTLVVIVILLIIKRIFEHYYVIINIIFIISRHTATCLCFYSFRIGSIIRSPLTLSIHPSLVFFFYSLCPVHCRKHADHARITLIVIIIANRLVFLSSLSLVILNIIIIILLLKFDRDSMYTYSLCASVA